MSGNRGARFRFGLKVRMMKFSTLDLLVLTAAVGLYAFMFSWGYSDRQEVSSGLMMGGGSVLFVGKFTQLWALTNCNDQLAMILERQNKWYLGAAGIGCAAIVVRAFQA